MSWSQPFKSTIPQRSYKVFPCLLLCSHYFQSTRTAYPNLYILQVLQKTHSLWGLWDILDHRIPGDSLLNFLAVKLLSVWCIWPFYSREQMCFRIFFYWMHILWIIQHPQWGLRVASCNQTYDYFFGEINFHTERKIKFIALGRSCQV